VRQPLRLPLQIRQAEVWRRHANEERLVLGALEPDHAECEREDGHSANDHDQPPPGKRRPGRLHLRDWACDGLFSHRMKMLTLTGCSKWSSNEAAGNEDPEAFSTVATKEQRVPGTLRGSSDREQCWGPFSASWSGIGMQPRQKEIHAPEAEDDHAEAEHLVERGAMPFPASVHASMDIGTVNQPDDQRPRLLRVPGPVPAPRIVGPHGAQDDPEGQQWKPDHDRLVAELVDLLQTRERVVDRASVPLALRALLEQVHHAEAARH